MKLRVTIIHILLLLYSVSVVAQELEIDRSRTRLECKHRGIKRCRHYSLTSSQIPLKFNDFRIVFVADTHYPSLFDSTTLLSLGAMLAELKPDLLLLGGDYQEGCQYVDPLFDTVMRCEPPHGALAVLGNNDYERCTDTILTSMAVHEIRMIEGDVDTIRIGEAHILIAGVRNHFTNPETEPSPTITLNDSDFVILLTHTPDYVEDQDISHTDIALAGHTHGGQVSFFGLYSPVVPSHYGQKFARGLKYNSSDIPIIITNGIGTSRKNIRFCARSEIIEITLHNK